jgi:hypothetical protein
MPTIIEYLKVVNSYDWRTRVDFRGVRLADAATEGNLQWLGILDLITAHTSPFP